jgi:hypothetical protein
MFAFGAVTQALMYHNQALSYNLFTNVFLPAYFVLGGQYFVLTGADNPATNMYPGKKAIFFLRINKIYIN